MIDSWCAPFGFRTEPHEVQDGQTYLIWCFEHCLKAEHAEAKDLADAFGFEFVCEKKSMGLLSWLESTAGAILLVAEWREAKPIMEELGKRSSSCNLSVCVVTRTDKTFRRVWFLAPEGRGAGCESPGCCPR